MNEETKETQKLKVGDVVYRTNSTMGGISKETIVSVTKTKAKTSGNADLRIDIGTNGHIRVFTSDRFCTVSYNIPTPSLDEKYKRQQLVNTLKRKIESIKINDLSNERIRELIDLI